MSTDNRTISEIVDNPEPEPELAEDEPELEEATGTVTDTTFMPQPEIIRAALQYAKPVAQAREDAHIPPQVSVKDLEDKTFVIVDKVRQSAFLPQDGTKREGYQCLCADVETGKTFTVWMGQVRLKKDLQLLNLPIRVTLTKRGRAWIFA